MTPFPKPFMLH